MPPHGTRRRGTTDPAEPRDSSPERTPSHHESEPIPEGDGRDGHRSLTAAFALAACSGGGAEKSDDAASGSGGGGGNSGYTFAMVTHETPGDTFWDKIKAGAQQAAKDTGSTLKYSNDPDPAKQATLIQNAVDSKVDGIATTLATPDALKGAVQSADRPPRSPRWPSTRASTSTRTPAR